MVVHLLSGESASMSGVADSRMSKQRVNERGVRGAYHPAATHASQDGRGRLWRQPGFRPRPGIVRALGRPRPDDLTPGRDMKFFVDGINLNDRPTREFQGGYPRTNHRA